MKCWTTDCIIYSILISINYYVVGRNRMSSKKKLRAFETVKTVVGVQI